jgi:hypothetical protein
LLLHPERADHARRVDENQVQAEARTKRGLSESAMRCRYPTSQVPVVKMYDLLPDHLLQRPARAIDPRIRLSQLYHHGSPSVYVLGIVPLCVETERETYSVSGMLDLFALSSQVSKDVGPDIFSLQCYPVGILQASRACSIKQTSSSIRAHPHKHAQASSFLAHRHSTSRYLPTTGPADPDRTPVHPNKANPIDPDDVSRPSFRAGLSAEILSEGLSARYQVQLT